MLRFLSLLILFLLATSGASAVPANAWHIPVNVEVPRDNDGTDPRRTMREPTGGFTAATTVTVYTGMQKFNNPGYGTANQTGGTLFFKGATAESWQSVALGFHANEGNNQFWKASFSLAGLAPGAGVQYYFLLTFDGGAEHTYLHAGPTVGSATATTDAPALAAPFTFNLVAPDPVLTVNGLNADYTTTKFFADEIRGDSAALDVVFRPGTDVIPGSVQVFTNFNRRDRAALDANSDGIADGILPPNGNFIAAADDSHYFRADPMPATATAGEYRLVLDEGNAGPLRTGAYRLTARWRAPGDPEGVYRWYSGPGTPRRDHAVVVSPVDARDITMYEINVFNIEANGIEYSQRSTFQDLSDRPGRLHTDPERPNQFNLEYLLALGVNTLWFQPYHPYAFAGRHLSAADINSRQGGDGASTWRWNAGSPSEDINYPYQLGSPYAVKNFWEIEPRMDANFAGDPNRFDDVTAPAARASAMTAFQNFVADADAAGIRIMPDAAFNHTGHDVELGEPGVRIWGGAGNPGNWAPSDRIDSREARIFSRAGNYAERAFDAASIAPAPDRGDFGKWLDVRDIFFGRYAALVALNPQDNGNFNNEGDWFDFTEETGAFDAYTRGTWQYFGEYVPYWLEKTRPAGQNRNSTPADGDALARRAWDARGIDGLRCDFGQGLPPQAWEYIINVARSYKWNFVFMAETLDGGAPPYRSNRHFDILNENILFAAKGAFTAPAFRSILEERRQAFGQGLVLLNTVSHDEDHYPDPWRALINYAVFGSVDGAPLVFPGQELGISQFFGYDLMERNFGKYIPHFKTYNSMMPLWADADFGNDQLFPVYAAINAARQFSPALRSSGRYFLNRASDAAPRNEIWSVAKFEQQDASPVRSDVVFAFVNLARSSPVSDTFRLDVDANGNGRNDFGIRQDRLYNVRNLAAYTGPNNAQPGRRNQWLFPNPRNGEELLGGGLFVSLNAVPGDAGTWSTAPFEAQYLKLYDVTPPPVPNAPTGPGDFTLTGNATFSWSPVTDDLGSVFTYHLTVSSDPEGMNVIYANDVGPETEVEVTIPYGTTAYARVRAISPAAIESPSPSAASAAVRSLDPEGDDDQDGVSNAAELLTGSDPLSGTSTFRGGVYAVSEGAFTLTFPTVVGTFYFIEYRSDLSSGSWVHLDTFIGSGETQTFTESDETRIAATASFYRLSVAPGTAF